jgi:hypothetical protein
VKRCWTAKGLTLLLAALVLGGCAGGTKVRDFGGLDPQRERETVYVVPFDTTLVPPEIGEPVFNEFVDLLNSRSRKTRVGKFLILKEELKEVEPAWLTRQTYISGDLWGFVANSGCCSTEMKVKSRVYLYEPGKDTPSVEVFVPEDEFFEHDRVSSAAGKARMADRLARSLADAIIRKLTP